MPHTKSSLLLAVMLYLLLVACSPSTVTLRGDPVSSTAVATATRVAHVADLAAAAVVRTLAAWHKSGLVSTETAQVYVTTIGPKVQASLDTLRVLLIAIETAPGGTTGEQVMQAVLLVQEAVATAQAFGADPVAWIATHGEQR